METNNGGKPLLHRKGKNDEYIDVPVIMKQGDQGGTLLVARVRREAEPADAMRTGSEC